MTGGDARGQRAQLRNDGALLRIESGQRAQLRNDGVLLRIESLYTISIDWGKCYQLVN